MTVNKKPLCKIKLSSQIGVAPIHDDKINYLSSSVNSNTRVFPKLYKVGNVGNKRFHEEDQMNSATKKKNSLQ